MPHTSGRKDYKSTPGHPNKAERFEALVSQLKGKKAKPRPKGKAKRASKTTQEPELFERGKAGAGSRFAAARRTKARGRYA